LGSDHLAPLTRFCGQSDEVIARRRVERLEEREQLVTDARAEKSRIVVRRIEGEGELSSLGVTEDFVAGRLDEGAQAIAFDGREDGEGVEGAAAKEADQERLGAIVPVMASRDAGAGPEACGGGAERSPTRVARACLEVAPSRDVDALDGEGDAPRLGDCTRELDFSRRRRSETMIDGVRVEGQSALGIARDDVCEDVE
jgi:hypothetical protein